MWRAVSGCALLACLLLGCDASVAVPNPDPGHPDPDPDPGGTPPPPPGHTTAPDTLFVEGWESGDLGAWHDVGRGHLAQVVTDAELARTGERVLRISIPPHQPGPWLTRFFMPGTESEELYARYHVRLAGEWVGGSKLLTIRGSRADDRWSAFGHAGLCPDGTDFFSVGLVTQASGDPGPVRFYVYYPGMARESDGVTCWGRYHSGSADGVYFPPLTIGRGGWHQVELWGKLNRVGHSDGELRFWIDGELRGHWSGIRLRESEDLRLNSIQINASLSERAESVERVYYFDDILVLDRLPGTN